MKYVCTLEGFIMQKCGFAVVAVTHLVVRKLVVDFWPCCVSGLLILYFYDVRTGP
jgi:hypothetical protein